MYESLAEIISLVSSEYNNFGSEQTQALLSEACVIESDNLQELLALSQLLHRSGMLFECQLTLEKILGRDSSNAAAIHALGCLHAEAGNFAEAEQLLEKAVTLDAVPAYLMSLGRLYQAGGNFTEAEKIARQLFILAPDGQREIRFLSGVLRACGRIEEALYILELGLSSQPSDWETISSYLLTAQYGSYSRDEANLERAARYISPLENALKEGGHRGGGCERNAKKIRIGYLSADFYQHPVGLFILPILANHDRELFDVRLYFNNSCNDFITDCITKQVDSISVVVNMDDDSLAKTIQNDEIDILINLSGHTPGNRLSVMPLRCAPVQLVWLGYPGTTGLSTIDYRISDLIADPDDRSSSEKIVRLEHGYLCYEIPWQVSPALTAPFESRSYITFGSFNNLAKITFDVIRVWSKILKTVPNSRLILKCFPFCDPEVKKRTADQFFSYGISGDRIELRTMDEGDVEHFKSYEELDIALDTFPYNGTRTTCDALYMGVPVVTLAGNSHAARMGATILHRVNLDDLVAVDEDDYVQKAVSLANDSIKLKTLHRTLHQTMLDSPLCDAKLITRAVEKAFLQLLGRQISDVDILKPIFESSIAIDQTGDDPGFSAMFDEANVFFRRADYAESEQIYRKILDMEPDNLRAAHAYAVVLHFQGKIDEAVYQLSEIISSHPEYLNAHFTLGNILREQHDYAGAYGCFRESIRLAPNFSLAHNNIANVIKAFGRVDEALGCYQTAFEIDPDYTEAHSNYLLALQYLSGTSLELLYRESIKWDLQHGLPMPRQKHKVLTDRHKRLCLGFVSADLKTHPVGLFFFPLLKHFERTEFKVVCYNNANRLDTFSYAIREKCDCWRDVFGLSDEELSEQIVEDQVDILFDLSGHTGGHRLLAFARKPAPIQITWGGYVGTTGMSAMDYLLSDIRQSPPAADAYTVEKILRLNRDYVCFHPPAYAPNVGPLPARINGYVTFGVLNNNCKISDECIAAWSLILGKLKESRILLRNSAYDDADTRAYYLAKFSEHGIHAGRILFEGRASHYDMLNTYNKVDIQLDTFPYSGGLTTIESLWMGVPVVSLYGELFCSRHSLTHLTTVGLESLAVSSVPEYCLTVCQLANNFDRLESLRVSLRTKVRLSSLCDGKGYARELERILRNIWQDYCAKQDHIASAGCGDESVLDEAAKLATSSKLTEALKRYERYLGQYPESARACHGYGVVLYRLGKFSEAVAQLRKALVIDPSYCDAYLNLGNMYREAEQYDEARACYRQVIRMKPDSVLAKANLADLYIKQDRFEDALQYAQQALIHEPNNEFALFLQAVASFRMKMAAAAISSLEQIIALKPDNAVAVGYLAAILIDCAEHERGIALYRRAIELTPGDIGLLQGYVQSLHYFAGSSSREVYEAARGCGDVITSKQADTTFFSQPRDFVVNRILKIGYVSPDFRQHPVAFFLKGVLFCHNRSEFEIFCYADVKPADRDQYTDDCQEAADHWIDSSQMSYLQLAQRIDADGIDILVDLAGHLSGNRLDVFALKPAPVQATWAGYVGTTGLSAMDYLISDANESPASADKWTTEQIIRLPGDYICYTPPEYAPDVAPLPAYQNGYITFGCFNNLAKITDFTLELWSRILQRCADARLLMKSPICTDPDIARRVFERFNAHGVAPHRIIIEGMSPHLEHLQRYASVDIQLDSHPYSGGLTTLESLWMGVPVITLPGELFSARHSLTHLTSVGLFEFIAGTPEEYIEIACRYANDLDSLVKIRSSLRDRMATSALCDGYSFTQGLEAVYRNMWGRWCNSQSVLAAPAFKDSIAQRKLHLGGKQPKEGWEIFNAVPGPYVDHLGDARDLSRFEDNTFVELYASHILEHFSYVGEVLEVLLEWHRVLKPDGMLRIAVPDLKALAQLVIQYESDPCKEHVFWIMRYILGGHIDDYDRHYSGFTYTVLERFLGCAGFSDIKKVTDFGLFDDSSTRCLYGVAISLNVEARKSTAVDSGSLMCTSSGLPIKYIDAIQLAKEHLAAGRIKSAREVLEQIKRYYPGDDAVMCLLSECSSDMEGTISQDTDGRSLVESLKCGDIAAVLAAAAGAIKNGDQRREEWLAYLTALFCSGNDSPEQITEAICSYIAACDAVADSLMPKPPARPKQRIAYVVNLDIQAEWPSLMPPLDCHDRDEVEVYCYADYSDFKKIPHQWFEAVDSIICSTGVSDSDLIKMIREDEPDVVVLVQDVVPGCRFSLGAFRLAPLQLILSELSYSYRLSAVDYSLHPSASLLNTKDMQFVLEYGEYCYRYDDGAPEPYHSPSARNGFFTFGSVAHPAVISESVLDVWAILLCKVEHSRLILGHVNFVSPQARLRVFEALVQRGVPEDSVCFYLAEEGAPWGFYKEVDVVLATFPVLQLRLLLDALWMGVAAVVLSSDSAVGEIFASVGMEEAVVNSCEEYSDYAFRLATLERHLLEDYRDTLRWTLFNSPICDVVSWVESFEKNVRKLSGGMPEAKVNQTKHEQDEIICTISGDEDLDISALISSVTTMSADFCSKGKESYRDGRYDDALELFREAIEYDDECFEAYMMLGMISMELGRLSESTVFFRSAAKLEPKNPEPQLSMAHLYFRTGSLAEAERACRRALALNVHNARALSLLGMIEMYGGRQADGFSHISKAVELNPDDGMIHSRKLMAMHYLTGIKPADLLHESRVWADRHSIQFGSHPTDIVSVDRDKVITVGYLSPDLCSHPVGYFLQSVLPHHNRSRFKIICYSDRLHEDGMSAQLKDAADVWLPCRHMTDEVLYHQIINDGVDILVDLAGHTANNRLRLFSSKPSPVQITWAGYVGTTGLDSMDYIISDLSQSPSGTEEEYAEKILHMPQSYVAYEDFSDFPVVLTEIPCKENGYITFGCLGNSVKVNEAVMESWSEIMTRVPDSRLLLKFLFWRDSSVMSRFQNMFEKFGIARDRLVFEGATGRYEHLSAYNRVDIVLDTFPYSGGLTTIEALLMGVPVITLPHDTFASRHALGHLTTVGLQECVAQTLDDYISCAVALAQDVDRLSVLRRNLPVKARNSSLCDGGSYCKALERQFISCWETWCDTHAN